ncbi:hypothetical protein [Antarcticirhabdus aurantiaca]|uniref:Uncharacterized protein n=1 Tax=Antarcticirhabdus aurantiaca TaxID=2606717 RepID=A0ACD4NMS9_9HYPH|nr:hypothetical protein [Antarcticirhabdus aurantiaca]WAJ28039.1 hypothetical protein OXU80_24965 [Jeongeuplla avenae]
MADFPTPEEIAASKEFHDLFRTWRIADAGLPNTVPGEEQRAWEADDAKRCDLARSVVTFRAPYLSCLRDKLDVLIRYASTAGENMDADERLLLEGLCALRADIVHLGG